MNIEKMREEFEARYPLAPGCVFHEGKYGFWIEWDESGEPEFSTGMGLTQMKWEAWQASRESLVIELPAENPLGSGPGDHGDGRPSFEQHCAAECNFILRDCRDAIHAAGVKTK